MKDGLTEAFEKYLYHAKELLSSCSKIKQVDAAILMLKMGEEKKEPPVEEKNFRDIQVGLSRAAYYLNKIKDIDAVEVPFIKEARAELDPICDYMREHMKTME